MELEKQVCSLKLAKRLKELGVKQGSEFYWHKDDYDQWLLSDDPDDGPAAFTVAELGEMLPDAVWKRSDKNRRKKVVAFFDEYKEDGQFSVLYKPHDDADGLLYHDDADTEADARAKMLIYLMENKLVAV